MKPMELGVYYYYGPKIYYLTQLVTGITWGGDITEASRSCEITLKNTLDGSARRIEDIGVGRKIHCSKNGTIFFTGIIFATTINHDGTMTISARDYNHYLMKNSDSKVYRKQKASQIVASICKQYGITAGKIDDTGYVIPKLILRNKTLYDMIIIALTETRKKTGKVFLLGNNNGKLTLTERKNQVVRLIISDGNNLLGASYSESIEDLRNSVRITGKSGEDAAGVTVSNAASIAKYGMMREKQHEGDMTDAQLKPVANALLAELNKVSQNSTVESIGDTSVIAGKSVQISEKMTGIVGGFYVTSDNHTLDVNGKHTMSLTVSKTLDVAEIEYEEPEEPSTSGSGSGGPVSAQRNSVADIAQSYKGNLKYKFGGTNIAGGSGDCSAFVQHVMKQAGVSLGRDTLSQVKQGTKIAKDDAKAGDLVFFQGTYRSGVSHVGIVTRKGYCVSLAASGCKEHSYTTGYWGGHFMQIRRVLP